MNSFPRRALARLSVLAVAATLTLGAATSLPTDALALPRDDGLFNTDNCTYAGKTYSEGSVVKMGDGKSYKCRNGKWEKTSFVPPVSTFPGTLEASQEMAPVYYNP